jgi:hypothetical protein
MRKLLNLSQVCLLVLMMVAVSACTKEKEEDTNNNEPTYVDLGLTSGTKWKSADEKNAASSANDYYRYDDAYNTFGDKIPSKEQWEELVNQCTWIWEGNGYEVVGPNDKSIRLSASGFSDCNGNAGYVGTVGYYWSSTLSGDNDAWFCGFSEGGTEIGNCPGCAGYSIRLVEN